MQHCSNAPTMATERLKRAIRIFMILSFSAGFTAKQLAPVRQQASSDAVVLVSFGVH